MSEASEEAERRYHAEDVDGIDSTEFAQEAFVAGVEWAQDHFVEANEKVTDAEVEAAARALAGLEPGEDWPTNEELGGHPILGTRDDEYRFGMREEARDVLEAAKAAREVQA